MKKLTFIESTGTQYINTGIFGKSGLQIELKAELTSTDGNMAFFGARDDFATNRLSWYYYQNTEMYYYYGSSGYPYVKRSDFAQKHNYIFDDNKVYIDGSQVSFSSSISAAQFTSKYTITVFACNEGGNIVQKSKMRLYGMRVYDGIELLADYIPALDENDVACLFDNVTKTYFYNQGTGTFVAGEETGDSGNGGNKFYYNGVLLPAIPSDVLAEYPYCWIRNDVLVGNYNLIFGKKPWYYTSNRFACSDKSTTPYYSIPIKSAAEASVWQFSENIVNESIKFWVVTDREPLWSNHDIRNGSATSTTIYFYGNSPVAAEPETPSERSRGYLVRSGPTIYTITDGTITALAETEITANLFQNHGVDEIPDGALLVGLTDPEVLYWHDSTDELPILSLTVTGTPPLPQVFTSEPMYMTHESIAGIKNAEVDASEDVRFAISFDDGASWQAFDGSSWFDVSDTAPGMLASTMNAITAEQWAGIVQLTAYRLRFWLPNVTAFVKSVVIHYINP